MSKALIENTDAARANLRDIAEVLDMVGAKWWIEAGTFLGFVRECGRFIGHDTDLDFGLLDVDKADEITRQLLERGFEVKHTFGERERGYEIAFIRNGVKADLFFFYRDGATLWHGAWKDGLLIRLEFPVNIIEPTLTDVMEGVVVRRPRAAETYLTARYGPDWRTPTSKWRWWCDPKCINWTKSELPKPDDV